PHKPNAIQQSPCAGGMTPRGSARERFSVKFYLVAMLFVTADIETVFLIPWGTIYFGGATGSTGGPSMRFLIVEMLVFMFISAVGYVYVWKRGALEWD